MEEAGGFDSNGDDLAASPATGLDDPKPGSAGADDPEDAPNEKDLAGAGVPVVPLTVVGVVFTASAGFPKLNPPKDELPDVLDVALLVLFAPPKVDAGAVELGAIDAPKLKDVFEAVSFDLVADAPKVDDFLRCSAGVSAEIEVPDACPNENGALIGSSVLGVSVAEGAGVEFEPKLNVDLGS